MTVYDTKTTDEYGVAELISPTLNTTGTQSFVVKHGSAPYNVSVDVVNVSNFLITYSSKYVGDGETITLKAEPRDSNQNTFSDLKVNVEQEDTAPNLLFAVLVQPPQIVDLSNPFDFE